MAVKMPSSLADDACRGPNKRWLEWGRRARTPVSKRQAGPRPDEAPGGTLTNESPKSHVGTTSTLSTMSTRAADEEQRLLATMMPWPIGNFAGQPMNHTNMYICKPNLPGAGHIKRLSRCPLSQQLASRSNEHASHSFEHEWMCCSKKPS